MTKKFSAIVFLIFLLNTSLHAIEPDVFVQSTVSLAISLSSLIFWSLSIFSDKSFDALLTVDIRGIGYYSLGPIRKTLNDEEIKKY